MNEIEIGEHEVAQARAWDARVRDPQNWTGKPGSKLSAEAQRNIDRALALLGPPVQSMDRNQAIAAADSYATKFNDVKRAFTGRLKGEKAMSMLEAYLMGPVFGFNIYAEGFAGVGKTWTMQQLSQLLDFPCSVMYARSDSSDAELVGDERLVQGGADGEKRIALAHGVVTKPGVMAVMIDEFPRLPGRSTNSCLQAMEYKTVRMPLNSLERPDHDVLLVPFCSFICCGNPASYVAQGERNRALYDRFHICIEVVRTDDAHTLEMYRDSGNVIAPNEDLRNFSKFSFRQVKAACRFARFEDDNKQFVSTQVDWKNQFHQLMAASAAVSPAEYVRRAGWGSNGAGHDKDCFTPTLDAFALTFKNTRAIREKYDRLMKLRRQVNENLFEGSNGRGELQILEVARALRILDMNGDARSRFDVKPDHLKRAFVMGNIARLKPFPGCEDAVRPIVEEAAEIFFF